MYVDKECFQSSACVYLCDIGLAWSRIMVIGRLMFTSIALRFDWKPYFVGISHRTCVHCESNGIIITISVWSNVIRPLDHTSGRGMKWKGGGRYLSVGTQGSNTTFKRSSRLSSFTVRLFEISFIFVQFLIILF